MSITPKFYGIATAGNFSFHPGEREYYSSYMHKFQDGDELEMTIGRKYKKRTSGQPDEETNFNGYLWGVVYKIIADAMGEWDMDYIHNLVQLEIGNFRLSPKGTKVPKGTSEMSGGEFADFCSKVRTWASMPGSIIQGSLYIPEPYEVVIPK
ncbi:MAG: hypothetical protein WC788_08220 [Candidatus Paceibacterota bacterium]|jgi:hypothetical protein